MIAETELAWMAAVADLKSLFLEKKNKKRKTPQLVLQVECKDAAVVNKLCELTGIVVEDRVFRRDFMQRACAQHCPEKHVHHDETWNMPQTERWAVTGAIAGVVLYNLQPYMVTANASSQQFMTAALANAAYAGRGSHVTKNALTRMLELGWEMPPQVLDNLLPCDIPGGRARPVKLVCGHERLLREPAAAGTQVWCTTCDRAQALQLIVGPAAVRHRKARPSRPSTNLSDTDIAWVAGVLDLKSSSLHRMKEQQQIESLNLYLQTKISAVAHRLSELTGCTRQPSESHFKEQWMQRACSEHCPEADITRTLPPQYPWALRNIAAAIVLYNTMPYMVHSQEFGVSTVVADVVKRTRYGKYSGKSPRNAVMRLVRLGWDLPPEVFEKMIAGENEPHPALSKGA